MPDAPWLSVIIPTYNGSAHLRQALDSIVVQDAADIEVIAVDDGSTDDTVSILRSYEQRLPITIIEQGRMANWVTGTNRGLSEASGRYASILHQDDLWLVGRLASVARAIERSTVDLLIAHPAWFLNEGGVRVGRWRCPLPAGVVLDPPAVTERLLVQNFFSLAGTVFPRAAAEEGLDERLWYTADWDLWLRLASRVPTLYMPRTLAAVRLHGSSITNTEAGRLDEFRWQHEEVLKRHLATWAVDGKRRRQVESAARFSVDVNVTLAAMANRLPSSVTALLGEAVRLGPRGWGRYLRNSRIHERVGSRLRAGLRRDRARGG